MWQKYTEKQFLKLRRKRIFVSAAVIFVLIPLTIFVGIEFLEDRSFLFISLLIIFYIMAPFFMMFEGRKPRAREIVLVAMMTALTALGNMICYITIPFQAGTAMAIVSGISLGPEAGFLVGALARFVCNFFLGQGPWTPWQMFCWGILGFLAGVVFNKKDLDKLNSRSFQVIAGPITGVVFAVLAAWLEWRISGDGIFMGWRLYVFGAVGLIAGYLIQRKRMPVDDLTLSVYGFLTTFIIYGGIMNISALVFNSYVSASGLDINWESLKILYISGVPYDFTHALGSAFFLFVFGEKVIRKVERVKIKYGIYR
ncbi:ECF transporter S component [Lacrimispora sp. NSJ-141]|uniref:ECF transporter S component n=1 Tax=Lientehia hominis TaxID=2897778 RepID=A0AAP2RFS5_9FIRM|nr:ECF transporter S component [Lientehia hominis]MCD2491136.1 ECF transporter S component [Lientehia hominis]